MNLSGQNVKHKVFGIGKVKEHIDNHMIVSFPDGEKNFIYPDAFKSFLTVENNDILNEINNDIAEKNASEKARITAAVSSYTEVKAAPSTRRNAPKVEPRANIAFKCNYCDGGSSSEQIGFNGVCSDEVIKNNIKVEKRVWCCADDCACKKYLNNEISRRELEQICEEGSSVCYESQMLRDWRALAGVVQNGERKGEPMKLKKVQKNSLCILTTKLPKSPESKRMIFAVFLADESYEGDNNEVGYVTTYSKYKIKLSLDESQKLLFWNYHSNQNASANPAWSSGLHRYLNDTEAVQILRDIVELKRNTDNFELAKDFMEHFIKVNGIKTNAVTEKSGALIHSS